MLYNQYTNAALKIITQGGVSMEFKKIVVVGGGILGSQIAYQTAYKGFDVTVWLRSEGSVDRAKPKFARWHEIYLHDLEAVKPLIGTETKLYPRGLIDDFKSLTPEKVDQLKAQADRAYESLHFELDMAKAMADADLVIESLSEDPKAKIAFYQQMAPVLPEKTIVVTNTSTLLPSMFAEYTGRPEKYLALHFANEIWKNNTAEIMGHPGTDQKYYDEIVVFAQQIGMIPLKLKKEQPGYILNSLLVPFLNAGQALLANEVADPETIDLTWMLATGAPAGPFRILDIVGLDTAYNIVIMDPAAKDPDSTKGKIARLLKKYIDAGKKGAAFGEGFYKYN